MDKAYMKGCLFMKKMFKKSLAAVMAVASLAVGMTGISASAIDESINLYKDAGAPGSDTRTSYSWNFTTSRTTMTMSVSGFTKTDNNSYVYLYATVNNNNVISRSVYNSDGSADASKLETGEAAYASASLNNLTGNLRAKVSIKG